MRLFSQKGKEFFCFAVTKVVAVTIVEHIMGDDIVCLGIYVNGVVGIDDEGHTTGIIARIAIQSIPYLLGLPHPARYTVSLPCFG